MAKNIDEVNDNISKLISDEETKKTNKRTAQIFEDLKSTLSNYFSSSDQWRRSSYESNWDTYHRNSRSIYDPEILQKKEEWQIKMFVPLTIKHIQRVVSQIYKTMIGLQPHFEMEIRPGGNADQAKMLKDLMIYYMDKCNFKLKYNDQINQAVTYGSGFSKLYWTTLKEKRSIRKPVRKKVPIGEMLTTLMTTGKLPSVVKYETVTEDVETFRGVNFDWVDIHDIFLDPSNINSWVFQRSKIKYGDLVRGVKDGYYYKDAVDRLKDVQETEDPPQDKKIEQDDLQETIIDTERTDYEKYHTVLEFWGRLPRKYIYWWKKFKEVEGNEIIPARCLMSFNGDEILNIEENDFYDGGNQYNKLDYIKMPGKHYGVGIAELLEQLQSELNELRNQRVDNATLNMNTMLAVREDSLVDESDLVSKPGGIIRIASKRTDDIRKVMSKIDRGYTAPSDFQETLEIEKESQEVTGIGRVTLGSGGQFAQDTNQTARGMQMLKQSSLELINYYTSLMEQSSFIEILRMFYMLIYQNITMDEIKNILGADKALQFELLPIEEVEKYYKFKPTGTFTMENRQAKVQSMMMLKQTFEGTPVLKLIPMANRLARLMEIDDPEEIVEQQPTNPQGTPGQPQMPGMGGQGQGNVAPPNPSFQAPTSSSNQIPGLENSLESPL